MGSNLNGFGGTVTYAARSQQGEAVMHFGGNAATTPNTDTTVGVAAQSTQKSHEAWLNAQLGVTLTNDIQMKKYNISEGTSVDNVTPALSRNDRDLGAKFTPADYVTVTHAQGAVYENHPVWNAITVLAPDNIIDINGYLHNVNVTDFETIITPGSALISSYRTNIVFAADTNPGHTFNIGGTTVVNG